MPSLPLVEVIWIDAYTDVTEEVNLDELASGTSKFGTVMECRDIGYLIRRNTREVVLAHSRCFADNTIRHSTTIPARWVRDIVHLQEVPNGPSLHSISDISER